MCGGGGVGGVCASPAAPVHHSSSDSQPQDSEGTLGSPISREQYTLVLGDSWVQEALYRTREPSYARPNLGAGNSGARRCRPDNLQGQGEASDCRHEGVSSDPQNPHGSSPGKSAGDSDKKVEEGAVRSQVCGSVSTTA